MYEWEEVCVSVTERDLYVCVEVEATQCALQRQTELDQTRTGQHVHTTTELKRQSMPTKLQC